MSTLSDLRHFIRRHDLLPAGSRVVVGVSGGPDSLALAHALWQLSAEFDWQLHAAYLHHGLRAEADEEAAFVADMAAAWGMGFTRGRADVMGIAAQPGVSVEEAARQARYVFLGETARAVGAQIIAVGHNADDQAETVIMHLLRGSGFAGLRGMLPRTPLAGLSLAAIASASRADFTGIHLVRPWLETARVQIVAYLAEYDLQPRLDATNTDTTFFRNRLRHDVMPRLRELNPRLTRTLGHTAAALQGDYETLAAFHRQQWQTLAVPEDGRVQIQLAGFRQLARGDQRALLRRAIAWLQPDLRNIAWEHSERLLDIIAWEPERASGGPYTLVAGLGAHLEYDWLTIRTDDAVGEYAPQISACIELPLPGQIDLGPGYMLASRPVSWAARPPWLQNPDPSRLWLPLDVARPLRLRPRQPDDRMRPLGLAGSKSVADLMTDLKLPRASRSSWPLLVDGRDDILWLVGRRAGEGSRVPADTGVAWEIQLVSTAGFADNADESENNL